MNTKIMQPGSITLSLHGQTYTVEGLDWDIDGKELIEEFKGLMVAAGFSPSVMDTEYGRWVWEEYDN